MGKTVTEQVEAGLRERGWDGNDCGCDRCKSMCRTPCTPTPEEVLKLCEAGYADKLAPTVTVLAHIGFMQGIVAPLQIEDENGPRCVFFENGLCQLHEKGLKPIEGRFASCQIPRGDMLRVLVGEAWKTRLGVEINTVLDRR